MNDTAFPCLLIGAFIGLIFGFGIGQEIENRAMQNQAVKHKAAEWVPNEHGQAIFTWKK